MLENLNKEILSFKETAIMEIANFGRNHEHTTGQKIYPAWFGEGDTSTSKLIVIKLLKHLIPVRHFIHIKMVLQNYVFNLLNI